MGLNQIHSNSQSLLCFSLQIHDFLESFCVSIELLQQDRNNEFYFLYMIEQAWNHISRKDLQ